MLQSLAAHLGNFTGDPKAFPEAAYEGTTVADYVKTAVGRIGENLVLNRFDRITSDGGRIYTYVHPPYKIAVLVELVAKGTIQNQDALNKLGENLSLHVASAAPTVLHRDEIPAETIESERSIYRNQALNEGKPEAFVDKMVEGRLRKYFEAVVLSEQNFALDEKQSIAKLLEAAGKEIGSPVEIKSFRRYQLGEASAAATTED
jgi:elongation factor Ts